MASIADKDGGSPLSSPVRTFNRILPNITLEGSPGEIGLKHGSVLKHRIRESWGWYNNLFRAAGAQSDDHVKLLSDKYAGIIKTFHEPYFVEIEAIAKGAGMDAWKIFALNSRTEIVLTLLRSKEGNKSASDQPTECTSLFCKEFGILAQNWDWDEKLEKLVVLSHIKRGDGHEMISMHEPGVLAKTGLNNKGVGVCLNVLDCPVSYGDLDGVPIHVLLRAGLDASSFQDAVSVYKRAKCGTSSHIFRGSFDGENAIVEYAGSRMELVNRDEETQGWPLHTNHYLGCDLADHPIHGYPSSSTAEKPVEVTSSRNRFTSGSKILAGRSEKVFSRGGAMDTVKALLRDDGENDNLQICRPFYKNESSTDGLSQAMGRSGTVCTCIMDLQRLELHITRGNPFEHPSFTVFDFGANTKHFCNLLGR